MRAPTRLVSLLFLATTVLGCDPEPVTDLGPDELGHVVAPVKTVCGTHSAPVFGIDVSKWQGNIDWARVKAAGVKYAFIRVSDGVSTLDDKFVANWVAAGTQGIPRGVYQFFRAHRDPVVQADIVIDHLLQYGVGELPPVIDVEATNDQTAETVARNVGIWIDQVEAALGVTPIIYTGPYFWDNSVRSTAFASYPLWIAHYTSAACPLVPNAWSRWAFWQYSSTGRVDGISGDVDMNRFDGTEAELLALAEDPACRQEPDRQVCSGGGVEACVGGRLTVIPCTGGAVCAAKTQGVGVMCMDPRCSGTVGEMGRFCSGPYERAECAGGAYTAVACGEDEVCEAGACVAEAVEPVEPGPEVGEVEPGPEPQPEAVEVAEMVEEGGAFALDPSRSLTGREVISGGCGAGGAVGLGWGLVVLLRVFRAGQREGRCTR